MKEITKHRLKQVNKLLKICLLTFCWLMASVGVTAYSVYWLRQNAHYEQEVVNKPTKKSLNQSYSDFAGVYVNREASWYISTRLGYDDYFNFGDITGEASVDVSVFASVHVRFGDRLYNNARVYVQFSYDNRYGLKYAYINYLWLYDDNNNVIQYIYTKDGTYNINVMLYVYKVNSVVSNYSQFSESYLGSTLDWCFKPIMSKKDGFLHYRLNNKSLGATHFYWDSNYQTLGITSPFVKGSDYFGGAYSLNVYLYSNNSVYRAITFHLRPVYYFLDTNRQIKSYYEITNDKNVYLLAMTDYEFEGDTYVLGSPVVAVGGYSIAYYKTITRGDNTQVNAPVYDIQGGYSSNTQLEDILIGVGTNEYQSDFIGGSNRGYTNKEVLDLIFVNTGTDVGSGGTYYDNNSANIGDVVGLMSMAFTGLIPILQIEVIPNITIGLLVFIPLIATIIIVVIRLVKK